MLLRASRTEDAEAAARSPSAALLARRYAQGCVILVNTVVLLALLNGATRLYSAVRDPAPDLASYCDRPAFDADDRAWCPQYVVDTARFGWVGGFRSFEMLRPAPIASATVNVDTNGVRLTPGSSDEPGALRIDLFGGSTMQGLGVSDAGTVPAFLLQRIGAAFGGRPVRAVNHGTGWAVSTQELTQLTLALRDGSRPDVVVFYDGINDVDAIVQDVDGVGPPGEIWPELRRAFAAVLEPPPPWWTRFGGDLLRMPFFSRARISLDHRLGIGRKARRRPLDPAAVDAGVDDAIRTYRANIAVARKLGEAYGFPVFAFWQPSAFVPLPSSCPASLVAEDAADYPEQPAAFRRAWPAARTACASGECVFLGDVFAAAQSRCPYIDDEHVAPHGNAAIADAMFARIEPTLRERLARGVSGPTASAW